MQGHDTHTQHARNFALQLPLPRQIICLRQLRRDFHPRVPFQPGHTSLPAAATSIGFAAQLRQSLFFGQADLGVTQLTFAGLGPELSVLPQVEMDGIEVK
jgi:hypothetical protein